MSDGDNATPRHRRGSGDHKSDPWANQWLTRTPRPSTVAAPWERLTVSRSTPDPGPDDDRLLRRQPHRWRARCRPHRQNRNGSTMGDGRRGIASTTSRMSSPPTPARTPRSPRGSRSSPCRRCRIWPRPVTARPTGCCTATRTVGRLCRPPTTGPRSTPSRFNRHRNAVDPSSWPAVAPQPCCPSSRWC